MLGEQVEVNVNVGDLQAEAFPKFGFGQLIAGNAVADAIEFLGDVRGLAKLPKHGSEPV